MRTGTPSQRPVRPWGTMRNWSRPLPPTSRVTSSPARFAVGTSSRSTSPRFIAEKLCARLGVVLTPTAFRSSGRSRPSSSICTAPSGEVPW